jgi:hypothetical protein
LRTRSEPTKLATVGDEGTGRHLPPRDVEAIFAAFVRNANGDRKRSPTPAMPIRRKDAFEIEPRMSSQSGSIPILLTHKKSESQPDAIVDDPPPRGPGQWTQRVEARRLVPRVASVETPEMPVPERSEDGLIPAGELDRLIGDMSVLLRYGHHGEVGERLEELHAKYPEDLLLLRRIALFHLEHENREHAMECLFKLASGLFERRNLVGMREALEQVLVLDPKNKRAYKLLGLLDARPGTR